MSRPVFLVVSSSICPEVICLWISLSGVEQPCSKTSGVSGGVEQTYSKTSGVSGGVDQTCSKTSGVSGGVGQTHSKTSGVSGGVGQTHSKTSGVSGGVEQTCSGPTGDTGVLGGVKQTCCKMSSSDNFGVAISVVYGEWTFSIGYSTEGIITLSASYKHIKLTVCMDVYTGEVWYC